MTEEQEIILDAWQQFAYPRGKGLWSGGLSTLESIECYLKRNKIINSIGNPKKK